MRKLLILAVSAISFSGAACGGGGGGAPPPGEDAGGGSDAAGGADAGARDGAVRDDGPSRRDGADGGAPGDDGGPVDAGPDVHADVMADALSSEGGSPDTGCTDGACGPKCTTTPTLLAASNNVWNIALSSTDAVFVVPGMGLGCVPPPGPDGGVLGGACDGGVSPGAIVKVPVHGGAAVTLATPNTPSGLALSSTVAVFGDEGGGLYTVPLKGGATTTIATTNGPPSNPATDGTTVFFADADGVKSVPIGGGATTTIVSAKEARVNSVAILGSDLILTGDPPTDAGAPDGGSPGGNVWMVSQAGGVPTTIATGQKWPLWPMAAGANPAWINSGDGALVGAVMEFTGVPTTIASGGSITLPIAMAYDGASFYVVTGAGWFAQIQTVDEKTGKISSIAGTQGTGGLAVDQDCVYYGSVFGKMPGLYTISK